MQNLRRKLLLGSAAAPLILTVRQASAHAKASNMACLGKDGHGNNYNHKPDDILASNPHADEWMRAKCDVVELTVWDHDKKKWLGLKDDRFFLGFDKSTYWKLDKHAPYSAPASASKYKKGHGVQEHKKGEVYPVVYAKDDGDIVGMAWETHGGKNFTKSCWMSAFPKHHNG